MAFLGASVPWEAIFAEGAAEQADMVRFELPGADTVEVGAADGAVRVDLSGVEPLWAAWTAAGVLARLWPGWLAPAAVGLVVACDGVTVEAGAAAMLERPGLQQGLWLLLCEVG